MSLSAGAKLGPYEILALIGAGGMGEVYRAHDTRLSRDVAIKVSAERFSERFEREARAIAALNHLNVCHLYDVGTNYLVMELVEGPTLQERIKNGAIPLAEALAIARQIADALEAAHEKGITHRDLKPGNIKIKPDGTVKVLDFGLAKIGGTPAARSDHSPTIPMGQTETGQTEAGMILGTAAYMSPEQAKGKPVDQRADIYSFGVVLYEMVTGTRLHEGETTTEVLASVIKEEPRWDKVPPQVQRLLRRCLEKDPQKRQRHMGDVMALVDDAPPASVPAIARPAPKKGLWAAVVAAIVLAATVAAILWVPWRPKVNTQAIRFEIQPTEKMTFINGGFPMLSPDGKWVVFPATGSDGVTRMWLRALDSVEVRPLAGTESGNNLPPPVFWSPDSRFIAFSSTPGPFAPGQLKKLDIAGGPPQTICNVPASVPGGTRNRDGVIVFGANSSPGLLRVSAAGGVATPVTVVDRSRGELAHRFPHFLPDARHFLYLRISSRPENSGIYTGSIDAMPEAQSLKPVMLSNRQAMYAASPGGGPGHLLFLRDTTLFAQPFDPGRLELSGEAVPVADLHTHDDVTVCIHGSEVRAKSPGGEWSNPGAVCMPGRTGVTEYTGKPRSHIVENVGSGVYHLALVENLRDSGWQSNAAVEVPGLKTTKESRAFRIYETELSSSSEPLHAHEVPVVVILVSGEAVAGDKPLDQPGSWTYVPAGEKHRVAAAAAARLVEIEVR
jgi:eukaryotic-like serine/threonine-protein kinase